MSVVEQESQKVAAIAAKLEGVRKENQSQAKELNDLRNRVVKLQDASVVDSLKSENSALGAELKDVSAKYADVSKQLEKALRDLVAAGPALDLAAAVAAVKG